VKLLKERMRKEGKLLPSSRELAKILREKGELPPAHEFLQGLRKEGEPPPTEKQSYERPADKPGDITPVMSELALADLPAKTQRWLTRQMKVNKRDTANNQKREAITPIEYSGLQEAYDHFNAALFDGTLPDVFITYQRKAHSFGYFSADRFSGRIGKFGKHELALNPDGFINQTDEQVCQTLVHEMTHVWQHAHGKPSARGYHNKEWAAKMKSIGLQPSSTGMVGGKETGQKMMDYIIPNGYATLAAAGWKLNLQSAHRPGQKGGTNSKTKFTCSSCGQNAWGKPDLAITCTLCRIEMKSEAVIGSYERDAA
jgi:hypothetical protein